MKANLLLEKIRRFDAYPKTLDDFRIKTFSGAAVTAVSCVIMAALFLSELVYYLTPEISEELFVDVTRGQKLRINVDVIFPQISCSFLSLDAMDVSGEQHINVEHNIYKQRRDLDGLPIEAATRETKLGEVPKEFQKLVATTLDPNRCESCYGAETEQKKCCNTCEEVQEAYRKKGWAFTKVKEVDQCVREGYEEKMKAHNKEGCYIYGYLEVNRVAGNFHIAPGRSYSQHHAHVHDLNPFSSYEFNLTHKIGHLSFGKNLIGKTNPLDGTQQVAEEGGMMFQYYIKIVPTLYPKSDGGVVYGNQFAVTRHKKAISILSGEGGMPGVFVTYEFSPLMVKYAEKKKSFMQFLTSVCAIIGGMFTVAGLVDAAIYHSACIIQKKIELGKAS